MDLTWILFFAVLFLGGIYTKWKNTQHIRRLRMTEKVRSYWGGRSTKAETEAAVERFNQMSEGIEGLFNSYNKDKVIFPNGSVIAFKDKGSEK